MKTATKQKASQNGHAQTLADLSIPDLKCMVYDESQLIHGLRQQMEARAANVQALNVEIAKRLADKESASPLT